MKYEIVLKVVVRSYKSVFRILSGQGATVLTAKTPMLAALEASWRQYMHCLKDCDGYQVLPLWRPEQCGGDKSVGHVMLRERISQKELKGTSLADKFAMRVLR